MKELLEEYKKRKDDIKNRLKYFKEVGKESNERIFSELCFCLCTPQSSAVACNKAITNLSDSRVLFEGNYDDILSGLIGVRFNRTKAERIVKAREIFTKNGSIEIKHILKKENLREWLVENIKGLGWKEAGHFMRNVGLGENIAILDRHIFRNLKKYGVIDEIPKTLTKRKYLEIEQAMREFSKKVKIPMAELDLLFWARQTGFIFK